MPSASALIRTFASLKLAVSLLIVLGTVLALAAVLESLHGRQFSQWYIYHTWWFSALLWLLGVVVFSAACVRFPWQRYQTGFVITHAGLLLVISGYLMELGRGIEGRVVLLEGASTDQMAVSERSQLSVSHTDRFQDSPYVFTFECGPRDWRSGMTLDIGRVDGLSARVLRYYHRSQPVENWVPDERHIGGPLVRFRLEGPQGSGRVEHFLADQDYGAEIFVGPLAIRLGRAISDAMLADFLQPADGEIGEKGLLTMYFQEHVQRARVDQHVGQTIAIGDSGAKVELVQYLANAKLNSAGKFQPLGEELRNPLVELKVNLPGEDEPYRQVAFAKSPLLNFDGVYERNCPVKFAYQHPTVSAAPAIEMLQAKDGKLYARSVTATGTTAIGEVTTASEFAIPGGFNFTLLEHLPHARRDIRFQSRRGEFDDDAVFELPAAEIEIDFAGAKRTFWLQRDGRDFAMGNIDTPGGPLRAQFTTAHVPLGLSLELIDLTAEPGRSSGGHASSIVRVVDSFSGSSSELEVSETRPLQHKNWRVDFLGVEDAGHGKQAATFDVAYDPGRQMKSTGILTIGLGVFLILYMRVVRTR